MCSFQERNLDKYINSEGFDCGDGFEEQPPFRSTLFTFSETPLTCIRPPPAHPTCSPSRRDPADAQALDHPVYIRPPQISRSQRAPANWTQVTRSDAPGFLFALFHARHCDALCHPFTRARLDFAVPGYPNGSLRDAHPVCFHALPTHRSVLFRFWHASVACPDDSL